MEVTVITRIPLDHTSIDLNSDGHNWCDVFVGATEKNAKTDAVNSVMIEWFDERVESGDEDETEDVNVIYDRYTEFWYDEEKWSIAVFQI